MISFYLFVVSHDRWRIPFENAARARIFVMLIVGDDFDGGQPPSGWLKSGSVSCGS
jgi:hypothetical protein